MPKTIEPPYRIDPDDRDLARQVIAAGDEAAKRASPLRPLLDYQKPPPEILDGWLIQAGRGSGKTAGIAKYVSDHANSPACILGGDMKHKMALIAPTLGDAVESADRHPICLRTINPGGRLLTKPGGTIFIFANGAEIKLFGTNSRRDVEHLRAGGNNCLVWVEELAAWPQLDEGWDQMQLGLRIGPHPHWVGSSTPKSRPKFREVVLEPRHHISRGSSDDNIYLDPSYKERLHHLFGGSAKGRQEIGGELLDEVEGAPWRREWIDDHRWRDDAPGGLAMVAVGIDPQGGGEGSGTTGIVTAGKTTGNCPCGKNLERLPHAFVLRDDSLSASPDGWARRAVTAFNQTSADRFAVERNFGGPMVETTIRTVMPSAPIHMVVASRGKTIRAEPVAALYEQGRVHHVGSFPELEDEMTTWTQDEPWSPNHMDALVWAVAELGLHESGELTSSVATVLAARIR